MADEVENVVSGCAESSSPSAREATPLKRGLEFPPQEKENSTPPKLACGSDAAGVANSNSKRPKLCSDASETSRTPIADNDFACSVVLPPPPLREGERDLDKPPPPDEPPPSSLEVPPSPPQQPSLQASRWQEGHLATNETSEKTEEQQLASKKKSGEHDEKKTEDQAEERDSPSKMACAARPVETLPCPPAAEPRPQSQPLLLQRPPQILPPQPPPQVFRPRFQPPKLNPCLAQCRPKCPEPPQWPQREGARVQAGCAPPPAHLEALGLKFLPRRPVGSPCNSTPTVHNNNATMMNMGGVAPMVSARELVNSAPDDIPAHRLKELKQHLEYILHEEDTAPPPTITAVYYEVCTGDCAGAGSDAGGDTAVAGGADSGDKVAQAGAAERAGSGQGEKKEVKAMLISPAFREGARAAADLALRLKLEAAKEGERVDLYLRQLRYTQDSVKGVFRDGRPLSQMQKELQNGDKSIAEIPLIAATPHQGKLFTVDNRRLWVFKHCDASHDLRIPVKVKRVDETFYKKWTTPTEGVSVRRRGQEGFA